MWLRRQYGHLEAYASANALVDPANQEALQWPDGTNAVRLRDRLAAGDASPLSALLVAEEADER